MALVLDNCEGILLSLDSHKSVPAPFLTKTYQLVDDPATDHIVSWGEDDTTFVVWRPPEFARDLLPNYFKHNNFSSFVRQLNTYGFRKIVPDRWEFANEFFKKGEKHLLCEIHRRKTSQPQVSINHHHHHPLNMTHPINNSPSFFPYANRVSISPPDSDDNNWCDSPPISSPPVQIPIPVITTTTAASTTNSIPASAAAAHYGGGTVTAALSEDNERLRRSNNMLMSELAHMRKLYNDIIYFVQNHVKPVSPSNNYPSSLILCNAASQASATTITNSSSLMQKPLNQFLGGPKQSCSSTTTLPQMMNISFNGCHTTSSPSKNSSSVTILEEQRESSRTKLFGVPLPLHHHHHNQSKKRLHPEYSSNSMETNKARFVMDKDDLGLNLMPPSPC
ncbi:OLC1v1016783C1 [Oldenlandia corymbosa var. corymbosa]|uniref:OLC1v1016783C1 n=1 Tax=Oldenlandia corymbosa var. corymbosa TaxID=529605 RepID=A0AAV1E7W8_OLDCO|nr:OLC1v1016783C1 [Oldenlandia corymbosa var. corymbosa]